MDDFFYVDWAIEEGVRHGGWCPRGRRTEDGPLPDFYRLRETSSSGYLQRTEGNVRDSDATLLFTLSDKLDGGSKRTADFAERLGKPWLHVRPWIAITPARPGWTIACRVKHGGWCPKGRKSKDGLIAYVRVRYSC
jgi:hypothetical protein